MWFGEVKTADALGAILAHSLGINGGKRLRKGLRLEQAQIDQLKAAGVGQVAIARPEKGDVLEDHAAQAIAERCMPDFIKYEKPRTGRVNFFAKADGIFRVSKDAVNALNAVDPGIAFSTLNDFEMVNAGRMVATIKIIPYAIAGALIDQINLIDLAKVIEVKPFKARKVGLVFSEHEKTKASVLAKTRKALEQRLMPSHSQIVVEGRASHDAQAVSEILRRSVAKCELLIIFGASAISDINDVIPHAVRLAGGRIVRFGMPVDPGNLLLLGKIGDVAVIGAPGCARSTSENGFDHVLQRLLADVEVRADDLGGMGVGGLLMETGMRPFPRQMPVTNEFKPAVIILAAGQSRRMGDLHKMTLNFQGKPMVCHAVDIALGAMSGNGGLSVYVVAGHQMEAVVQALGDREVVIVHNRDYLAGLSTSLRAGIGMVQSRQHTHALLMLGDMPFISTSDVERMLQASRANPECIIVATAQGKRGNPVLWPAMCFDALLSVSGDTGARNLIGLYEALVLEVEAGDGARLDLDTPEAVANASGRRKK